MQLHQLVSHSWWLQLRRLQSSAMDDSQTSVEDDVSRAQSDLDGREAKILLQTGNPSRNLVFTGVQPCHLQAEI